MKKNILTIVFVSLLLFQCGKKDNNDAPTPPQEVTPLNLSAMDNGNRVMMQTFYWDVEPRGDWWNLTATKLTDWKANGVNRIWLPPATKGQSGGYSMGYDPSDYFDFGEYNQHGTVETRFGSRAELENLIKKAHDNGLEVIADVVLGHNSGGGLEYNVTRGKETYTMFNEQHGNASGKFNRSHLDFHPNDYHCCDEAADFFSEQDLCHHKEYVQNWLWKSDESVAKYYKNTMKFDGWRFDYVKSFGAWVVKDWMASVGGFAVGEYWDGDAQKLKNWVDESGGVPAFDFACFYKLEQALDKNDMRHLMGNQMLRTIYPDKAVTFVANHDTEKDKNLDNIISKERKLLAYAYMLTHSGYPTIFISDYENDEFKAKIQNLLLIHRSLAVGEEKFYLASDTEFIDFRLGDENSPGLMLFLNSGNAPATRTIPTHWKNKTLIDYTQQSATRPVTDANGKVTITVGANSYGVWSTSN
ncbi:alpha-amylase [Capnocytophaga sp. H2931]|uniref:alpha-amylase n=1 Tax=Capnocytophaga sp. H2931 TaxID=1945657 RepID=UPI000BB1BC5B|nr:alpha-amylase [Capnocytophaga sp. H2931]ATA74953.1 alpha-amylase [Capnocytophaga sp. H2931]